MTPDEICKRIELLSDKIWDNEEENYEMENEIAKLNKLLDKEGSE